MNRWLLGFLSSVGCMLVLSAVLVVLISIMNAISYSPSYLWKIPISLPLAIFGVWLLRRLDKTEEER